MWGVEYPVFPLPGDSSIALLRGCVNGNGGAFAFAFRGDSFGGCWRGSLAPVSPAVFST